MIKDLEKEFVKILKQNQRLIHKVCKIYSENTIEHEDLFQEIVIELWKSFPKFRGDAKITTWMYRIALNTAMTSFKRNKRNKLYDNYFIISERLEIENLDFDSDEEKIKKMYQAIYFLTDVEKALIMMYLDDKSYKEIGEILGITEVYARVKMNRAKNNLKKIIRKKS